MTFYPPNSTLARLTPLLSATRLAHCQRVSEMASQLATQNGLDAKKAAWIGLVHDCAKQLTPEDLVRMGIPKPEGSDETYRLYPAIWHSHVGPVVVKHLFDIDDPEISHAIQCHTTGAADLPALSLLIYIADYCEAGRDFPSRALIENLAMTAGLYASGYAVVMSTLYHLIKQGRPLHIDTFFFRNWVMTQLNSAKRREIEITLWPLLS